MNFYWQTAPIERHTDNPEFVIKLDDDMRNMTDDLQSKRQTTSGRLSYNRSCAFRRDYNNTSENSRSQMLASMYNCHNSVNDMIKLQKRYKKTLIRT